MRGSIAVVICSKGGREGERREGGRKEGRRGNEKKVIRIRQNNKIRIKVDCSSI